MNDRPPRKVNPKVIRALAGALGHPHDRDPPGARWWNQQLVDQADRLLRGRRLLGLTSVSAGLSLVGGGCLPVLADLQPDPEPEAPAAQALEVQMRDGWNVGLEARTLMFPGETEVDVAGSAEWKQNLGDLAITLAPGQERLAPFYVPTLFQSLSAPAALSLRASIRPIFTPAMQVAYARGLGLASLFQAGNFPTDVALVVDLPGPEAVAVAAALADHFEPVFTFDNWPHPAGVVPSHLTLAAALYYRPMFERARGARPVAAPPVFVLDGDRLSEYTDEQFEFDNRYTARLPGPEALAKLGIHHVLYVVSGQVVEERDDLNDDFVAFERAGVDVRMLSLIDFRPGEVPLASPWEPPVALDQGDPAYYWNGDWEFHLRFWDWYGWRGGGRVSYGPPPPHLAPWCHYRPRVRVTMFSGVHRNGAWVRPSHDFTGFGQVSPGRASPTSSWRSGSLGRWHGSFLS